MAKREEPLTDKEWQIIKDAAIAGTPLRKLADEFCVSFDCVRQRALRQDWPIPGRIANIQRKAAIRSSMSRDTVAPTKDMSHGVATASKGQKSALQLASEAAKEAVNSCLSAYATRRAEGLKKALRKELVPEGLMEEGLMIRNLRQAAGLDKQERTTTVAVSVAIGPWSAAEPCRPAEGRVIEGESTVQDGPITEP